MQGIFNIAERVALQLPLNPYFDHSGLMGYRANKQIPVIAFSIRAENTVLNVACFVRYLPCDNGANACCNMLQIVCKCFSSNIK